jgi:hypothetical protein
MHNIGLDFKLLEKYRRAPLSKAQRDVILSVAPTLVAAVEDSISSAYTSFETHDRGSRRRASTRFREIENKAFFLTSP